jgi:dolichyl-diphosphooligosaccharide---protein glycosyltransferase
MIQGHRILFRVHEFNFRSRHLLVILVLGIAFTSTFIIRFYPAKYGFYLNEMDPFFNYRATKYILDHGLESYWKWHDNLSWYPEGRDVPRSSQSGLHIISAYLYVLFGRNLVTLLDFTIILPVILGSLSTIVIFALVRTISGGNTTAGMFSSLLFALSPSIIQRGNLGWFKSEPLGLFLGLICLYLFLSALKDKEIKYSILKCATAGIALGLANTTWGGVQYFSIPISLFLISLAFLRRDLRVVVYVAITFTFFTVLFAAAFPRPGISFVVGLPGLALIGATVFLINAHFLKNFSKWQNVKRDRIFLLAAFIVGAFAALIGGTYHTSDFRYLDALSPFLSPDTSFTEFVAEHAKPTLVEGFGYHSVLLFFAGLGAWLCFHMKKETLVFALIIGITGVYVSSGLVRLLVYATVGTLILASIGLSEITHNFLHKSHRVVTSTQNRRNFRNEKKIIKGVKKIFNLFSEGGSIGLTFREKFVEVGFIISIIFILIIPIIFPYGISWLNQADNPPSIIETENYYNIRTKDWLDSLRWIERNTPKDAVIAAWWDYGYWITALGNRTTLADNATINQTRIAMIAKMLMDKPEAGIRLAKHLKADYILVYVVAQPFSINNTLYYVLGSGGEESKIGSIIGSAGLNEKQYIHRNLFTDRFWNSTLIGNLLPFIRQGYTNFENGQPSSVLQEPELGASSIYLKKVKYAINNTVNSNSVSLVYSSPSFRNSNEHRSNMSAILIYKLNNELN